MIDAIMNFIGWLTVGFISSCLAVWTALAALDKPEADLVLVFYVALIAGVLTFVAVVDASPYPEVWFND